VIAEYQPGQRIVLARNPYYWRKAADGTQLPYLDRLVLELVPDQNTELLRLQAGAIDLVSEALRPEDFVSARRAEQQGALRMVEVGVATDADAFWFCMKPETRKKDRRFAFVQKREFRQALSHAIDREEFARTVYLGEAVPVWGPVTPGNRPWFTPNLPRYPPDLQRARDLLKSIGLEDRDGNGVVEDPSGTEARFTLITQRGIASYEAGTTLLREQAAKIGIALDVVPLEFGAMIPRHARVPVRRDLHARPDDGSGSRPQPRFLLTSGSAHVWDIEEKTPTTPWEQQIDALMLEQASTIDGAKRRELFASAQRIFAENVPVLYFAAPRMYSAYTSRVDRCRPIGDSSTAALERGLAGRRRRPDRTLTIWSRFSSAACFSHSFSWLSPRQRRCC
jgi:peptide/nickel transport system substrate-binding protein